MKILAALLRIYSCLFHVAFGLFLLVVALLAASPGAKLNLEMLPWQDETMQVYGLIASGLAAIVLAVLALRGKWRVLFLLWTVLVFVFMIRGYFFSSYTFPDEEAFRNAVYLILGSLVSIGGAWSAFRRRKPSRTPSEAAA